MRLYFAPGACSIGIHYLLEEISQPYQLKKVDIRAGQNFEPWYSALNPKRKVPTLQRSDGSILTEFPVIARYLAEAHPSAKQLPSDKEALLRASELTEFLVSTVHMQGFSRAFRPEKFAPDAAAHDEVRRRGLEIIHDGLAVVERQIEPGAALGATRSFADGALFYVLFWACERLKLDVPATCVARWRELRSRPAAQRVFAAEGIML